jgi:hypothetical protein
MCKRKSLPIVSPVCGCETYSLTLREEENRLKVGREWGVEENI